uniref:Integrase family protein n=1 Tax=Desulfovibrio desulfuricans (strain ATCC 27774 / DSM 6949 / MB) TaxID=525146 RepID=B8J300_DESDA
MSIGCKKNGTWYVQYRIPGEKYPLREYTGIGEEGKTAARELDRQVKEQKAKGAVTKRVQRTGRIHLDQLAQAYLTERKLSGKSAQWLEEMETLFNKKILPRLCFCPVDDLKYPDVIAMAAEAWPTVSLATRQRYLGYLKAAFNFGRKHELTATNPLDKWERQKEPRLEFNFSVPDLLKLYDCAAPHLAWAIKVEWHIGTRPGRSELFALRWRHIDFESRIIKIYGTKTDGSFRAVPMLPHFEAALKEKRKQALGEFVVDYKGRQVKKLQTAFEGAQRRANLGYHVRLYDIRHLFATTMLNGGADHAAVAKLLGHSAVSTTHKWYYHVLPGETRRALAVKPDPF